MTTQDFKDSIQQDTVPQGLGDVQQALWYAGKGEWKKAHDTSAQQRQ